MTRTNEWTKEWTSDTEVGSWVWWNRGGRNILLECARKRTDLWVFWYASTFWANFIINNDNLIYPLFSTKNNYIDMILVRILNMALKNRLQPQKYAWAKRSLEFERPGNSNSQKFNIISFAHYWCSHSWTYRSCHCSSLSESSNDVVHLSIWSKRQHLSTAAITTQIKCAFQNCSYICKCQYNGNICTWTHNCDWRYFEGIYWIYIEISVR